MLISNLALCLLGLEDGQFLTRNDVLGTLCVTVDDCVANFEIETGPGIASRLVNDVVASQRTWDQRQVAVDTREIDVGVRKVAAGGIVLVVTM